MKEMTYFLGTHQVHWLEIPGPPLFISRRRLGRLRNGAQVVRKWALDSGGFTELSMHGEWTISPEQYVQEVQAAAVLGGLQWAAIQDWMCEPVITAKTLPGTPHAQAVAWHQVMTVNSYTTLRRLAPELPWAPVIQGWTVEDYLGCVALYDVLAPGWRDAPAIGVGSVCRRQGTKEAEQIFRGLAGLGVERMHAFGAKVRGVARYADVLGSSDSMAWSYHARRVGRPLCHANATHKNCANCRIWAERWYGQIQKQIQDQQEQLQRHFLAQRRYKPQQLDLWRDVA